LENARILFRGASTKSGLRRFVPLRNSAVEEMKTWGVERDKKIFPWQYTSNVSKLFRELLRELNLRKTNFGSRSFHTLRHTYASHLLMSGVNIFVVSRWLGHSSVNVTEKHYGHLIPNSVEVKLPW
jgi:integrase